MKRLAALLAMAIAVPAQAQPDSTLLVIAHRGASGERPEHTLAAYERAIDQGAHYIEPDLVPTRDGVLVARHENEISGTTDVADRPEFAGRRATRTIDGEAVTGWFTEDFTLAELRTLRARERLPHLRPGNVRFDGMYAVPTLAEVIALVRAREAQTGRRIGLYPELKHPTYFASIGHDVAATLVGELHEAGYRTAQDPVFIQNFEVGVLVRLSTMTDLPLVQLLAGSGGPADDPQASYAAMATGDGLARIAAYADAIGAELSLLVDGEGRPTGLADTAHASGLAVHGWTLRKENAFLPPRHRSSADPAAAGRIGGLLGDLLAAGIDGIFTDDPAPVLAATASGR